MPDVSRCAATANGLQQSLSGRAGAGNGCAAQREHPRRPADPAGRQSPSAGARRPMERRLARPMGRRDARRRNRQLPRADRAALPDRPGDDDVGRAIPPRRRGSRRLSLHDHGPDYLYEAVHGGAAAESHRGAGARVRVPRRQLQPAARARRRAFPGKRNG